MGVSVGGGWSLYLTLARQTRKTTLLNSFQSAYIISAKPKQKSKCREASYDEVEGMFGDWVGGDGCRAGFVGQMSVENFCAMLIFPQESFFAIAGQTETAEGDGRTRVDGPWFTVNGSSAASTLKNPQLSKSLAIIIIIILGRRRDNTGKWTRKLGSGCGVRRT